LANGLITKKVFLSHPLDDRGQRNLEIQAKREEKVQFLLRLKTHAMLAHFTGQGTKTEHRIRSSVESDGA